MSWHRILVLAALACLSGRAAGVESPSCATTLEGLRLVSGDASFPLRLEEISMSDGKPLVVSIQEKDGALFLEFVKTREGLWAEGAAVVCHGGAGLEARIGQPRIGPAAPWIARQSAGHARVFTLSRGAGGHVRIATFGWSATFLAK